MALVLETRSIKISGVIFNLSDIHKLAKAAESHFKDKKRSYISFTVDAADGSRFESTSSEIFDSESKCAHKRLDSVEFWLTSSDDDSKLHVSIRHGGKYGNSIEVKGHDSVWVNGVLGTLSEIIASCRRQEGFIYEHPKLIQTFLAFCLGTLYNAVLDLLPITPSKEPPSWAIPLRGFFHAYPIFFYLFRSALGLAAGWMPALYLVEKLQSLWPTVELQIGPEHNFLEAKRRKLISWIVVVVVIPFLISFFYDLMKWWAL